MVSCITALGDIRELFAGDKEGQEDGLPNTQSRLDENAYPRTKLVQAHPINSQRTVVIRDRRCSSLNQKD